MSLIFSQLVYVDYFGVGGHGGVGMHADREQRNNEIVSLIKILKINLWFKVDFFFNFFKRWLWFLDM
jgi:hypothetical protein